LLDLPACCPKVSQFLSLSNSKVVMPYGATWLGYAHLWNPIWRKQAPDDQENASHSFGPMLNFQSNNISQGHSDIKNKTMSESLDYLLAHTPHTFHNLLRLFFFMCRSDRRTNYSHGVARTREEVEQNERKMETWINPLEARLPLAPDMRIYCLYSL
jgi:phospholipid:diacylglycerol acyltransferase